VVADGQRLAYHMASGPALFERNTSGAGAGETVLQAKNAVYINDWSPDGSSLLYTETAPDSQNDLWILPRTGDRKPVPFLKSAFNESHGQFSPDGKWIAYTSDEPGESEVFVQGRAAGEFKWQVSNGGGNFPRWRRDGKELYYRALDGNLMSIPVRANANGLEFGKATTLFRIVEPMGTFAYPYDAAPDGQRILTLVPSGGGRSLPPLTLLVNWETGLKQ
jgi:Tol biopolymer transport system component